MYVPPGSTEVWRRCAADTEKKSYAKVKQFCPDGIMRMKEWSFLLHERQYVSIRICLTKAFPDIMYG